MNRIENDCLEWLRNTYGGVNYDPTVKSLARFVGAQINQSVEAALKESEIFCLGCAKKETVTTPSRSSVVGLAAVHSSGMICIPNTIRALLQEST